MFLSLTGVRGDDTELCKDSTGDTGDVRAIPRSRQKSHCTPARCCADGEDGGGDGTLPLGGAGDDGDRSWR